MSASLCCTNFLFFLLYFYLVVVVVMPKEDKARDWLLYGVHDSNFVECTEYELEEARKIKGSKPPLVIALESLRKTLELVEDELYED